ncbi:sulfotransferase [Nocardioides sp. C4-1]|uniref:sulfotransferase n=1 Tax=Nocardioides sp. C4-1 TaxID=3151851 RepID=UPI0032658414
MQLIIAGFHRSGTSLMTQLLHRAGLFVGTDLLGAMPSNQYGHLEDRDFLRLHRSILRRHGEEWQWDVPFPHFIGRNHWRRMARLARERDLEHEMWGFKDPRVCLFLGAWKHVMPDAKVVMIYRDPAECVRSLEHRQAGEYFRGLDEPTDDTVARAPHHLRFFTEPDHGLRVWDTYNRAMVAFAEGHLDDCLVVPHTDLLRGRPVVAQIRERFGAPLGDVAVEEVLDPLAIGARVAPQRVASAEVAERVHQTWQSLERLASRTEN